jgi:hypothetical protein
VRPPHAEETSNLSERAPAMTEKTTKPARKRVISRKPKTSTRKPTHDEISVRAYFLHLQAPESDEVGNWLRAERELTPA